jgi:hypothetical protein
MNNELGELLSARWAEERSVLIERQTAARETIDRLEARVRSLDSELALVQSSHSWFLTKPLRSAFRGYVALRNRMTRPNGN